MYVFSNLVFIPLTNTEPLLIITLGYFSSKLYVKNANVERPLLPSFNCILFF